jgi:hypothetical protein
MESVADPSERPCDGCLSLSNDLVERADDALCPKCTTVFSAATMLFDNSITEENEVIPTLVSACMLMRPNDLAALTRSDEAYPELELVKEGVRWGENNRGVISYSYQYQGYYLE